MAQRRYLMSLLDGGNFRENSRKEFPANNKDVEALHNIIMEGLKDQKVQQALITSIQNNPNSTPDVVGKMAAMLAFRIMSQVQEQFKVEVAEKSVMGMILMICSELYALVQRMGGPPVNDQILQQTAQIAIQMLDQVEQQQQQGPPQGQPQAPQGGM